MTSKRSLVCGVSISDTGRGSSVLKISYLSSKGTSLFPVYLFDVRPFCILIYVPKEHRIILNTLHGDCISVRGKLLEKGES